MHQANCQLLLLQKLFHLQLLCLELWITLPTVNIKQNQLYLNIIDQLKYQTVCRTKLIDIFYKYVISSKYLHNMYQNNCNRDLMKHK